jgi:electron transfer flavoprotein alpha subunit
MTETARIRRDPRETAAARVRPAARLQADATTPAPVVLEAPACHVLAVADLPAGRFSPADREMLGAARQLADLLGGALVLLAGRPPGAVLRLRPEQAGADRVMLPVDPAYGDLAETRLPFVLAAARACDARHLLFPDTFIGGELARRVAARLGERPAAQLRRLSADAATVAADSGRLDAQRPLPRVLIPRPGAFAPLPPGPPREARPIALAAAAAAPLARVARILPVEPATVPLAEADLILSAGAGVTDWPAFHRAAAALGAAEAGSRVVCDDGKLPRDRQVGVSGVVVSPRCYLAFGIAGAAQHMGGMAEAERVVAVNADPAAEMMRRADLVIVADAQAVLPALARRAVERAQGRDDA